MGIVKSSLRGQREDSESNEKVDGNNEMQELIMSKRGQEEIETSDGEEEDGVVRDYEDVLKVVGFGLFQLLLMVINGLALLSDVFEILSVSYIIQVIRRHDEFGVTDAQSALLSSVIFIGMLFGSFMWGGLSDVSGRRFILLTSMSVNGAFGLMSAFAPNFPTFIVFRFVSGIG